MPPFYSSSDKKSTGVVQICNISPSVTRDQLYTFMSHMGNVKEMKLYPMETNPLYSTYDRKMGFIRYEAPESAEAALHLTNTVLVDRAIMVLPYFQSYIADEMTALKMVVPGLPGERSLPVHVINQIQQVGTDQVIQTIDPQLAAHGLHPYPPLPSNTDAAKVEEIRRTVYVGEIAKEASGDELSDFLSEKVGEVMYLRFAGGDPDLNCLHAYVEFCHQSSVVCALMLNRKLEFHSGFLRFQHATTGLEKPKNLHKTNEAAQLEVEEAMRRHNATADPLVAKVMEYNEERNSRSKSRYSRSPARRVRPSKSPYRSPSPIRSRNRKSRTRSPRRNSRSPRRRRISRSRSKDRGSRRRRSSRSRSKDRRVDRSRDHSDRRRRSTSKSAEKRRDRDKDRAAGRKTSKNRSPDRRRTDRKEKEKRSRSRDRSKRDKKHTEKSIEKVKKEDNSDREDVLSEPEDKMKAESGSDMEKEVEALFKEKRDKRVGSREKKKDKKIRKSKSPSRERDSSRRSKGSSSKRKSSRSRDHSREKKKGKDHKKKSGSKEKSSRDTGSSKKRDRSSDVSPRKQRDESPSESDGGPTPSSSGRRRKTSVSSSDEIKKIASRSASPVEVKRELQHYEEVPDAKADDSSSDDDRKFGPLVPPREKSGSASPRSDVKRRSKLDDLFDEIAASSLGDGHHKRSSSESS